MQSLNKIFNQLSLDRKILILIAVEVAGFCIVGFVAVSQLRIVGDEAERMAKTILPLYIPAENIRTQILSRILETRGIMIAANADGSAMQSGWFSGYFEDEKEVQKSIKATEEFIQRSVVQLSENENALTLHSEALLQNLLNLRWAAQTHYEWTIKLLQQIEDHSLPVNPEITQGIIDSEAVLMDQLETLTARLGTIRQESTRHVVYAERIAIGFVILTLLMVVIFFIAMLLLIVRRNISKPLQLLTDTINAFTAMQEVEESEFEKVIMARRDELGRMSRSFNRLKHDLWSQGQDLQDAKEEAERANRAKSMFLAAASHDLRQPLQAMQMYIAALRQKIDSSDALAVVEDIDAVSLSTARQLSALLDVSQLEAGAIQPSFEDFPIQEVLNRVFREFAPVAQQKNLDFQLVPSIVYVRSDPILLERILGNFMSNAIRYTHQGRILLGVRRKDSAIAVEVWDTGRGFPNDQALKIFEDFHQIDNEERDRSKGLGLGLAIAKRLAACLSHRIECDSVVGKGSRFAILVALSKKRLAENLPKAGLLENLTHGLQGIRVLLVEDDVEVLKATRQLLKSWGCEVVTGRNIDEVIAMVERRAAAPPDVIIADNRLPGGAEGVEIASRVQKIIGHTIPTVIVTGDVQEDHLRDISGYGYQVMFKPVQPARLRSLISNMINAQACA